MLVTGCSTEPNLGRSMRTVDETRAQLKPRMTTDQLHDYLDTTPILVREGRLHWRLKDGSLWTNFEQSERGLIIVGAQAEKAP